MRTFSISLAAAFFTALCTATAQPPVIGALERDGTDKIAGAVLVSELGCAACHSSGQTAFAAKLGADLSAVAARVNGEHLRRFIANPSDVKPGTTMPDVLAHLPGAERAAAAEALAHYLASLGKPETSKLPEAAAVERGRELYHSVGCVACHSPEKAIAGSVPLGPLAEKYTLASLSAFLKDPLATEVTRITDTDGDGRADRYDTVSDRWGFANYHEFASGSKFDSAGNLYVALGLSESYHSKAEFRGWALKIAPDGTTIPLCSGLRSPLGVGANEHGEMFYAESQGPWNGSCSLKHLKPGGFMGHPVSFNWYPLAPNMGPAPARPASPSRMNIERKRVKELVPYAVVFPYKKMGRSLSGFEVNRSGGKFGPFENQIFIGDYTLSLVMRATTEKVNGVWQGACYPFREGLGTGLLAVHFTPDGRLVAGGTNRGWPVRGMKDNLLQRLDWTGRVPFEILEIRAQPDGFLLRFTLPVDASLASRPQSYQLQTYTHIYQQGYGSPEVDHTRPAVTAAEVAPDGLSVRLRVSGLVQGHVHDFHLPSFKSRDGSPLLHDRAYYTLNEIPTP